MHILYSTCIRDLKSGIPRIANELIPCLPFIVAVIILQIVYAPAGEGVRINRLVPQATGVATAGILARVRIHAKAQAESMQVISHSSHTAREFCRIRDQSVVVRCIAPRAPTVIEDYIVITQILEAVVYNQPRRLEKQRLGDIAAKSVPIVLGLFSKCLLLDDCRRETYPAHLWGKCEAIIYCYDLRHSQRQCSKNSN